MSKPFDACRAGGGKIRTMSMKGGKYMHICSLGGKSYRGEIKEKKGTEMANKGESPVAAAMGKMMKKEMK